MATDTQRERADSSDSQSHEPASIEIALVHLDKPLDLAMVAQVAAATGQVKVDLVGTALSFDHPKVVSKLRSWNMANPNQQLEGVSERFSSLDELRRQRAHARFIGTVVSGGENPFTFDWHDGDIIIIGGAEGLSRDSVGKMDAVVTIPTAPGVAFLTVNTVVSALVYHILTRRGLWGNQAADKAGK